MNIPLAHTMGGEVTGTIDESIRHAITKLAHIHFPANQEAGDRILRLGEAPDTVHVVGCPRMDLVAEVVGNGGAGALVGGGGLGGEGVRAAVDVRVVAALVAVDRLDRGQGALGGGAGVEVGDRLPVHLALERGKGGADARDVELAGARP